MSEDRFPSVTPEQVEAILRFARRRKVRVVHYVGNADKNLIVALIGLVGSKHVSIMDMPNRWGGGTRFFWDEFESSGIPYPEAPDWLEDVTSYQEGSPDDMDLWIQESAWSHPKQLLRMLAFRRARGWPPTPHVVLLDKARSIHRSKIFDWTTEADVDFGILKPSVKPPRRATPAPLPD